MASRGRFLDPLPLSLRRFKGLRKAVAGGRGGGTGAAAVGGGGGGVERTEPDAMQASFFPLLSVDDEVNPGQQSASHYHRNSNFNENERNGQFSCTIGSAPVAAATSAAKPALDPATKIAPISSRPFASKPVQQRDRGIGQPFRAHPATPSPTYHSISHSGCQGRSAEGVIASSGNASGGSSSAGGGGFRGGGSDGGASNGGERHKPFTPRSLALDSDASAELIASRASPQQNASARSTSGFSSTWGGGGGAVDGGSSQVSGGGHEDSKGQIGGQHNQPLSRQLLRSTNASTASSPSASCASSPRGWARDGGAILGYGGSSSIGGGVIAPPHGSRADIGEGSGGAGGRRYSQGVMRPPKSSNGDASGVINNSNSGESNAAAAGRGGVANDSTTRAVPAQARGHGDEGNTGIEGVLLPGPEGGVEVREFDGGVLMVRRNEEQKKKSPERLNLHRRRLRSCPVVQGDTRLRLLNYQNNLISKVTNVANLPNLIFLDLYNNNIDTMEGPLSMMVGLRVMMIGKNKITKISNLGSLRKLDVLDLHSNSIRDIEGLASLQDLRVLNLAGNQIRAVENVRTLTALTELNLRRNNIEKVTELDALPRLQRLFLSNNRINSFQDCSCIFSVRSLLELSLDGNPVAGENGLGSSYRRYVLHHLPDLRHLDLKRVTDHDQPFSKQQQQQQHSQRERGQQSSTMRSGSVRGKGVAEERSLAGSAGAMTTAATAGDSSCSQDNSRYSAGSSDGGMSMSMSRAAEAREAVAAKRSKEDKDERERRALRERREAIEAARQTSSIGAPGGGADKTKTAGGGGGGGVDARRSRETSGSSSSGGQGSSTSSGGGGGGGSGGSGGGVGYFELEQRLSAAAAEGGARSAAPGARKSSGGGISITLKVYGDVWRWLADDKVCSLREQVVEARFSLVHVTSVAKKAAVIAQTFPYLSCLQLLDNDIRSLKQIERLRPLLRGLASLHLGKNPVTKNASAIALRAWVAAQSRGLLLDLPANDIGDEGQKRVAKHPANITPGRATQPGGGTHAPPPPPTAQRPIPPPGGGEHDTGHRRGEVEHHSGESGTVEPSSPSSPSRTVSMPVATATGDVRDGCGAVDCGDFLAAGTSQMTSQVAVAFERLAQARNRAATSSWGAVALARLTAAENRTGRSVVHGGRGEVARDSAGAWAASSRGAKLACNGMVRRVCETHKRDGNFDEAWESAVKRIVKGVLTETRVNAEDDQARRHSASTGNWCGSTCSTGEHSSETAATDGRGTTNSDVGRGGIGGTSAYGVRTYTPRAQWLDDW
eukprot:g19400.t1